MKNCFVTDYSSNILDFNRILSFKIKIKKSKGFLKGHKPKVFWYFAMNIVKGYRAGCPRLLRLRLVRSPV